MRSVSIAILVICMLVPSGVVFATDDEFARGQTTVTAGLNTITVDNNVKYVNYVLGDTIPVTLNYSSTCNVALSGVTLRMPNSFTPRGVAGLISNVGGTPGLGVPALGAGTATFDIQFTALKKAGHSKQFGVAHLDLVFGVDDTCSGTIDGTTTVGVQISVSTASHP